MQKIGLFSRERLRRLFHRDRTRSDTVEAPAEIDDAAPAPSVPKDPVNKIKKKRRHTFTEHQHNSSRERPDAAQTLTFDPTIPNPGPKESSVSASGSKRPAEERSRTFSEDVAERNKERPPVVPRLPSEASIAAGLKKHSEDVAERNLNAENEARNLKRRSLASGEESYLRKLAANPHSSGDFYMRKLHSIWYD